MQPWLSVFKLFGFYRSTQ